MRASIASSLCALSLLASGCGESHVHTGAEVRAAFAKHGLPLWTFDVEAATRANYGIHVVRPSPTLLAYLARFAEAVLT